MGSICLVLTGLISQVDGTEPQYLLSIAVAESGTIYLADRNLPGIWKRENEKLEVFFQGSKTFRTPLNAIRCVAIDADGNLLAGDSSTREVYRFDKSGKPVGLTHQAGADSTAKADDSGKDKKSTGNAAPPAPFGEVGIPMDIAVNAAGDLFVSDLEIHRVVKIPQAGGQVEVFAEVQAPRGLCFDADQNLWVISGRQLLKIAPDGKKETVVADGTLQFPHTVAAGPDKTVYICDGYAKCVWKMAPGGQPEKLISGDPLVNPVGMRLAGDRLLVVDPRAKAMFQITLDGKLSTVPLSP